MLGLSTLALVIVGVIVGFLLITMIILSRYYKKVGPDEALIVYGGGTKKGWKPVIGGAAVIIPMLQTYKKISLQLMSIPVEVKNAYSSEGVPVTINAVANVKINGDKEFLPKAVERFLGRDQHVDRRDSENEIKSIIRETLEGQLRDIIGTLTVEELYKERDKFVESILKQIQKELDKIGVLIDIMNIQTISDERKYLDSIGIKRTAEIQRDAAIGKAQAEAESIKKSAIAAKEGQVEKAEQDRQIAEAQKKLNVAQAEYQGETWRAEKTAEQEGPKAQAIAKQAVKTEEVKILEAEQVALQKVQEERIKVEKNKFTAERVVPADAEREARILKATGEAEAIKLEADAKAQAVRQVGTAEADVIRLKLEAEAKGLREKADAWKQYGDAANFMNILDTYKVLMGEVAGAASQMKLDKVVVIDQGNGNGKGNAVARTLNALPAGMLNMFEQLNAMTGINLQGFVKNLTDKTTKGVTGPAPTAAETAEHLEPEATKKKQATKKEAAETES